MFRKTTWMYAGVIFWATLAGNAIAADAPATRTHEITIDDYFSLATIGEVKVSPDGKYVAYTQTRWQPPDELRNTDIWVVEIETKKNWRVTFDDADDTGIQWGPASDKIYFASGRTRAGEEKPPLDGKNQIWMTTLQGGSSRPVTRVQDGISAFELSRDGRYAYYTVASDKDEAPFKELREKFATVEYAAGKTKTSKLFRLDLETWRAEELYAADRYIRYFAVSPDQARVAMITDPDNRLVTHEGQSRVDILDVASREVTTLTDEKWRDEAPSPHGWLENLAWSDDSAQLAFTVAFDGFPSEIMIGAQGEGGKYFVQQLPRSGDYYVEGGLDWKQQKNASVALQFRAADRGRTRIFEQNIDTGETRTFTSADVDITAFDEVDQPAGATNVIAASMTGEPGNLFIVRPSIMSSAPPYERLTNINPQVRNWILPRIEVAQWQAPDGTTVEGILELPHNGKEGNAPLPLVVEIHGGPTSSTKVAMRYWIYGRTLLASKGYALMSPNYRGTTGYGDTFKTDLVGRESDIEVQDILSGVDAMIERGIADPER
ncbi:MAG: prolyl oligopeptidase family serine peptidase, partial [Phycisphaerae bacterium]